MYKIIAKSLFWIIAIISVAITVWGFMGAFEQNGNLGVDVILQWAYGLFTASIALVILGVLLNLMSNPKSLVKSGLGIIIIAAVVAVAYFTSTGSPLVGYMGVQPDVTELKLTETLLSLVYILGGAAIISILIGEVISIIRK